MRKIVPSLASRRLGRTLEVKPKKDLTTGPIMPQLVLFCIPLLLSGMLQLLYNAADMIVLGQFASDAAVGAVGSCSSLINLIVTLFIGLSVGVNVSAAQFIGAKRDGDVSEVVHTALSLSLIMGVMVGALGFFLADPALRLMGTLDSTLPEAVPYMKAYMAGIPGMMIYNYLAAVLRAKGDTVRPLIFLGASGVVNVALNTWMVAGLGMGALGVGIATAASQYLVAAIIIVYMATALQGPCRLSLRRLVIKWDKALLILKIGIPAGLQSTLFSISNVLIQSSINSFGLQYVVDGNAAAANIEGFVYIAVNSVYQGAITFVGQTVGARKYDRFNRVVFCCMGLVTIIGIVTGALVVLFGSPLLRFYISSPNAIAIGQLRLWFIAAPCFICGLMDVGCGTLRGMGKTLAPMIISLMGGCLFRILWIFSAFQLVHTHACLFLSYPLSWLITGAIHFVLIFRSKREMERLADK